MKHFLPVAHPLLYHLDNPVIYAPCKGAFTFTRSSSPTESGYSNKAAGKGGGEGFPDAGTQFLAF
ncbi:hypothetical protein [Chitinophaga filiformis]|uniref:Uncharacterized protein n=1 Tax=Chitinophaga filiformis TaxID=104663 RepID=A0ABY4I8J6_CHIFI|nr:hypothetical protein [Chitinophaga filiformis]UPK72220.1 hypothetical protein MYF79_13080 [Chitinophaga filiformis]